MKKLFLCLVLFFASSSLADSFQIIRDSEIENNLKETGVVDKITANKLKEKYDER